MSASWRSSPIISGFTVLVGIAAAIYLAIKTPLLFPLVIILVAMVALFLHRKLRKA